MNNYYFLVEEELRRNQIKENLKYEEFKKLSLKNLNKLLYSNSHMQLGFLFILKY